jgi:hypothetical protein
MNNTFYPGQTSREYLNYYLLDDAIIFMRRDVNTLGVDKLYIYTMANE